jgi:hypothetical protein
MACAAAAPEQGYNAQSTVGVLYTRGDRAMGGKGFKHHSKVIWPGVSEITQRHVAKVGRNEPCPCGSEKKYKDCHESEGTTYLEKLALEDDRRRIREGRERLKQQGVPWFKRIFYRG